MLNDIRYAVRTLRRSFGFAVILTAITVVTCGVSLRADAQAHDPRYARFADRSIHLFDGRVVEEKMEMA
jgi:hypothetical protein